MVSNRHIVKVLNDMAALYEMEDDRFRARAYERASEEVATLDREVQDIYHEQGLKGVRGIPGVGDGIAHHLELLVTTGSFPEFQKLHAKVPAHITELRQIAGVGPKAIRDLYLNLGIRTVRDLEKAARAGKIRSLPGFGERSEEKILQGISFLKKNVGRYWLGDVRELVQTMEEQLRLIEGVDQVTTAGSYRRRQETVGDIDVLVTAKDAKKVMKVFLEMPEVAEVLAHGPTKSTVRLKMGIQADVRVVPDEDYGAALQYFTGSKDHNVDVRTIAVRKGYKLNEYGLFKGKKKIAGRTEEEVYRALGLLYIEPELRTASGEIEAARAGKLPHLISYGSIRGDLQVQTSWTDGRDSIEVMARAAVEEKLSYIAITDHTRSLAMTGGLDEKKLARQGREIDKINAKLKSKDVKIRILKSAEVNILKDGTLDIADEALAKLDLVCVAVHGYWKLTEREQTERIIKTMKHPLVNILFHPTGRIVNQREPYAVDIDKIIRAAKEYGVALEVNASERLDLRDIYIRRAVEAGAKLVIDTDAHSVTHFANLDLGVAQARRGWATKKDVLNTQSCDAFLKALKGLKRKSH